MFKLITASVAACSLPLSAIAGDKYILQPVQVGAETVRYNQGEATVVLDGPQGSVQIQPLPFDHGGMSFGIAVFNAGSTASNFDISNVTVTVDGVPVQIYSRQELEKKARNRAFWGSFALALAGGIAATAQASQRDTYRATTYTRHGTYTTVMTTPSASGQIAAAATTAGTVYGLSEIRSKLDSTIANLRDEIVQLSTVDPNDSYGGRLVLAKVKFRKKAVPNVRMHVMFNGQGYDFAFRVVKPGTPAPVWVATPTEPAAQSTIPTGTTTTSR